MKSEEFSFQLLFATRKDTHKEKAASNGTSALTKNRNMGNWVIDTSNRLFIRGS